ncbi:ArsR/SmtB family transcription factor [Vagococcus fluvialis]|jgi:DNA-binding transcriptional ArsR family regulator|uniref:ArsR/SmtB family transcription factor n=1 Tax=Vagococcus fluvialis TaxID=2738 RepID=UPI0022E5B09D|nr:metalloregulator ArsR/SmtB family transcription factor [Vagococcus fluvialis]
MKKNSCDVDLIHLEDVKTCQKEYDKINSELLLSQLKLIADEKRFKILHSLSIKEELCVCDLANILDASIATTSHHLQQLKKIGAVDSRKDGKLLYYKLKNKTLSQIIEFGLTLNSGSVNHG